MFVGVNINVKTKIFTLIYSYVWSLMFLPWKEYWLTGRIYSFYRKYFLEIKKNYLVNSFLMKSQSVLEHFI